MIDAHVQIATSRKNIRIEIGELEHLTLLLTTNASGECLTPYFLFPAGISTVPTSTIEGEDPLISTKGDAYMDQELFKQFLSYFIDIAHARNPGRPNLLILDGHNSRLDENTLTSAAVQGIHILCLPSHLTHLLQPNDANFNFLVKKCLKDEIEQFLATQQTLSYGILSHLVLKAACHESIAESIRSSYRKCGVYPYDDGRLLQLLEEENPSKPLSSEAIEVLEHVRSLEKERKEAKERFTKVKESEVKLVGKKRFFKSTYAQVLTTSKIIAYVRLDNIWKEVRMLKAESLQKWVIEQPEYTEKDLLKENGKKKTVKELHTMIFDDLKKVHAVLEAGIKSWIDKNLVVLPSTAQLREAANQ